MYTTRARSNDYHKSAAAFLLLCSDEMLLTLGLLADAATENVLLVRVFDVESFDKTSARRALNEFLRNVSFLFLQPHRGCLKTTSFTSFAIKLLREKQVTVVVDGEAKTFGGAEPSPEVMDRAFARLEAWVQVARATLEAEFPSFEILGTFEMFSLSLDISAEFRDHVKRLSQLWGISWRNLEQQILALRPIALDFLEELKVEGKYRDMDIVAEAWRGAIILSKCDDLPLPSHFDLHRISKVLAKFGTREVRRALMCSIVWMFSTSGIERLFSRQVVTSRMSRAELSEDLIDQEMLCLMTEDLPSTGGDEAVCAKAQEIWEQWYGPPRVGCNARADKGRKKAKPQPGFTETSFLRQRQLEVSAASEAASSSLQGGVCKKRRGLTICV